MPSNRILYLDMVEGEHIHGMKLAGIRRYAGARGWNVEGVAQRDSRPSTIRGLLRTRRPMGCIVECSGERVVLSPERFGDVPIVYLNCSRNPYGGRTPMIVTDNEAVARAAFRELSANRPAAYAVVGFAEERIWSRVRARTFRALAAAAGGTCSVFIRRDESAGERSARLSLWVARLPRSCAVFAVNDRTAVEVVAACRTAHRRIPHDLTLLSVDNNETLCRASDPPISSIQLDFERSGYQAAKLLDDVLSDRRDIPVRTPLLPLLAVRRESTRGFGRREPRILAAVEMIRREACEGLTARELVARFPGSRSLFELRFREAMGRSVLDEIEHVRLEKVETLLARTDTSIGAIASFCGYRSDIALRKFFRSRTGMSMREWRAKNRS